MNNDFWEKLSAIQKKATDNHLSLNQLLEFEREVKNAIQTKLTQLRESHGLMPKINYPKFNLRYLLSAPFIYSMIFPAIIWHVSLEIYQQVCFRLYGIPLVNSKEYFVLDRELMSLLSFWEKLNCVYCSYVNNLIRFSAEIGGRTERFWCPIKYYKRLSHPHSQYDKFVGVKSKRELKEHWEELRDFSDLEG